MPDTATHVVLADRLTDAGLRAALRLVVALPYARRVRVLGALLARAVGPAAGMQRRAHGQLALALPDLTQAQRARLVRASLDNFGRSLAEIYSGAEFVDHPDHGPRLVGPGREAVLHARAAGRPVILVTAHFGNLLAPVAAFARAGHPPAMLHRALSNPLSETHWADALSAISSPLFGRDRRGLAAMARHVRDGGFLALAADQHVVGAPVLEFFGRPARTTASPAALALRHGALLVPAFDIRQSDGLGHGVEVQTPIPHDTAEAMMQDYNHRLEEVIRRHPGQWLWAHRRWKD